MPMVLPFKVVQREKTPLKVKKSHISSILLDNIAKHLEAGNIFYLSNKLFLIPKTCFLSVYKFGENTFQAFI